MKRGMTILLALALLLCAVCAAEATLEPTAAVTVEPEASPAPEALTGGKELSGYFGGDIAQAAEEIGGLTPEEGEEFTDNYIGEGVALRGNGGVVTLIDLKPENALDSLCGIQNGMTRDDAQALMDGVPLMWDYPEELAWLIRADAVDELRDEILVVFFDDDAKVAGAWYRVSGM